MATVTKPIALDESFNTTETPSRNIADVLASLGDAISQGAQPVTKKLATNSFKTINGGLVDGLTVQFTPIQDLHGYSKPWAGGAGKNYGQVYDRSRTLTGTTVVSDSSTEEITVNGTAGASETTPKASYLTKFTLPAGSYKARMFASGNLPANCYLRLTLSDASTVYGELNAINTDYSFTLSETTEIIGIFRQQTGAEFNNFKFKFMITLASVDNTTWEPWANICPITGHTQVQSKINNTTNTTSLGDTYYGGDVEQVSGEGEVTFKTITFDGSADESWNIIGGSHRVYIAINDIDTSTPDSEKAPILCNLYETDKYNPNPSHAITGRKDIAQINIFDDSLIVSGTSITDWKTWLSNNPLQVVYKLATPTTLSLTGQNIVADVGVNNVSAPLTGQSIKPDSVIYKDMFTWEDVLKVI